MQRKWHKLITLVLTAAMFTAVGGPSVYGEPNAAIGATKSKINEVGQNIRSSEDKIASLNQRILEISSEIKANRADIEALNTKISETAADMVEAEGKLKVQEAVYGERLRENYKSGSVGTIQAILSATSIADLLIKVKVIKSINREDQKLIAQVKEMKSALSDKDVKLKADQAELLDLSGKLASNQEELNLSKESQIAELDNLNEERGFESTSKIRKSPCLIRSRRY